MKALSYTSIKEFAKSPNHLINYWSRAANPSQAMILGSAFHCLLLEPDKFNYRYAVAPDVDKRTKEGKFQFEQFVLSTEGREVISQSDYQTINYMAAAARIDDVILMDIQAEIEVAGDINGVPFRGFVDALHDNYIVDVKTTRSAHPDDFMRDAANMKYHLQAAIYLELTGRKDYFIIAVENRQPFNVQLYIMTDEMIEKGREELLILTEKYKVWDGTPSGYAEKCLKLALPYWY
jgi:hypothetical protein